MAGIEAVVFDFGNVLIKWNPEAWYDARIGREARERLFAEVPLEEMNLRSDRGEHLADLVAETAAQYPAHADNIRAWYDNWIEMAQPDIQVQSMNHDSYDTSGVAHPQAFFELNVVRLSQV